MRIVRFLLLLVAVCLAWFAESASARVVVSEVMWMGSDASSADEWVELTCVGDDSGAQADLSGWRLMSRSGDGSDRLLLQFASGTVLVPWQVFLVSNMEADVSRLAVSPDIVTTSVSLPNTKLLLTLFDASGAVVDQVDDGVGTPFAGQNATGSGVRASMERIDFTLPGAQQSNWRTAETARGFDAGAPLLGTPGFPNGTEEAGEPGGAEEPEEEEETEESFLSSYPFASSISFISFSSSSTSQTSSTFSTSSASSPQTSSASSASSVSPGIEASITILLTEVLPNPVGRDDEEWIEIANTGTGAVDIAGWMLQSGAGRYTIPAGSASGLVLLPGEHRVFRKTVSGLTLGNEGGAIALFHGDTVADAWEYPAIPEGLSYGRISAESGELALLCTPTENARNTINPPTVGIAMQSVKGGQISGADIVGEGSVSLNLEVRVLSGPAVNSRCRWDFGDGFVSDSCNPPSHTFARAGTSVISLEFLDACGERAVADLIVEVREPEEEEELLFTPAGVSSSIFSSSFLSLPSSISSSLSPSCIPSFSTGVLVSEFLPNPAGDDEAGEWIELVNMLPHTAELCGWALDDGEAGSKPFLLDAFQIPAGGFLLLTRSETGLALNNDGDAVRLSGPANAAPVQVVEYGAVKEGRSFAQQSDGVWAWSTVPTPGSANGFGNAFPQSSSSVRSRVSSSAKPARAASKILPIQSRNAVFSVSKKPAGVSVLSALKTKYRNVLPPGEESAGAVAERQLPHPYLSAFAGQNQLARNPKNPTYSGVEGGMIPLAVLLGVLLLRKGSL